MGTPLLKRAKRCLNFLPARNPGDGLRLGDALKVGDPSYLRVNRSGGFVYRAYNARSAKRGANLPSLRGSGLGLRCARVVAE